MYANRISVTSSDKESYIRFECIVPKINDDTLGEFDIIEKCDVVMPRNLLIEMKNLIDSVTSPTESKE